MTGMTTAYGTARTRFGRPRSRKDGRFTADHHVLCPPALPYDEDAAIVSQRHHFDVQFTDTLGFIIVYNAIELNYDTHIAPGMQNVRFMNRANRETSSAPITPGGIDGMVRWHFVLDQTWGHVHFGANRRYLGMARTIGPCTTTVPLGRV